MLHDPPARRPEPGYEVTDVGESMWELYVRSRHLTQVLEHFAFASDPYRPTNPAEAFVLVTTCVADLKKWAARTATILEERAA